jgi:hypothetical protein
MLSDRVKATNNRRLEPPYAGAPKDTSLLAAYHLRIGGKGDVEALFQEAIASSHVFTIGTPNTGRWRSSSLRRASPAEATADQGAVRVFHSVWASRPSRLNRGMICSWITWRKAKASIIGSTTPALSGG